MSASDERFRVISQEDQCRVYCSFCTREVKHVAVLPALHAAVCAYCVLEMAKALASAQDKR